MVQATPTLGGLSRTRLIFEIASVILLILLLLVVVVVCTSVRCCPVHRLYHNILELLNLFNHNSVIAQSFYRYCPIPITCVIINTGVEFHSIFQQINHKVSGSIFFPEL